MWLKCMYIMNQSKDYNKFTCPYVCITYACKSATSLH